MLLRYGVSRSTFSQSRHRGSAAHSRNLWSNSKQTDLLDYWLIELFPCFVGKTLTAFSAAQAPAETGALRTVAILLDQHFYDVHKKTFET